MIAYRYSGHPTPCREPAWQALALRRNSVVSSSIQQTKIEGISTGSGCLNDVTVRLTGLMATPNHSAVTQIPIACRSP